MNPEFKNFLLKITNSSDCSEVEIIQSLWSGYGKISRYQLVNSTFQTVVVKCISLNKSDHHPRAWNTSFSHNRKVKSYEIETVWYQKWSALCSPKSRIPTFIGSYSMDNNTWIILEDLNPSFPLRKHHLNLPEVKVCLKWLANFHITFLCHQPIGLWEIGTYWNLQTRPEEFDKINHQELKSKAHRIDQLLNQCRFQTIVHGDAKLANFCFSTNSENVAAVDFQYVGGGCGIKDVTYFLGSCLTSAACELHQEELLDFYFAELESAFEAKNFSFNFKELEKEWRTMYPIACTDFTRFLLGWMPSHQKLHSYNLNIMNSVLAQL